MRQVAHSAWRRIGRTFLAGLLAILPLVLTILIVVWVSGYVQQLIGPGTFLGRRLESVGLQFAANPTAAYAIGWGFVLGAVFVLGLLAETGAKRFTQRLFDAAIQRIPLVGSVYGTSKQLVEMFDRDGESEMKAMSVVFCFFGEEGGTTLLALMPSPERFQIEGRDYHVVIIPTAPVPFGGGLFFMPAEQVKPANMSVDGLMSIYVSMGVTAPQFLKPPTLDPPSEKKRG